MITDEIEEHLEVRAWAGRNGLEDGMQSEFEDWRDELNGERQPINWLVVILIGLALWLLIVLGGVSLAEYVRNHPA